MTEGEAGRGGFGPLVVTTAALAVVPLVGVIPRGSSFPSSELLAAAATVLTVATVAMAKVAGHAVAAGLVGMRVDLAAAGPVAARRTPNGLRWGVNRDWRAFLGSSQVTPNPDRNLVTQGTAWGAGGLAGVTVLTLGLWGAVVAVALANGGFPVSPGPSAEAMATVLASAVMLTLAWPVFALRFVRWRNALRHDGPAAVGWATPSPVPVATTDAEETALVTPAAPSPVQGGSDLGAVNGVMTAVAAAIGRWVIPPVVIALHAVAFVLDRSVGLIAPLWVTALGILALIALHELAHAAVGRCHGFRLAMLVVGPIGFARSRLGRHFGRNAAGCWTAGAVVLVPPPTIDERLIRAWRHVALAGPLANLLVGAGLFAVAAIAGWDGPFVATVTALAILGTLFGLLSLVPVRAGNLLSDGAAFQLTRGGGPGASAFAERLRFGLLFVAAERPAEWPADLVARARQALDAFARGEGDAPEADRAVAAAMLLGFHHADRGEHDLARRMLATVADAPRAADQRRGAYVWLDVLSALYGVHSGGDVAAARAALGRIPRHSPARRLPLVRSAEAAVLLAEGQTARAIALSRRLPARHDPVAALFGASRLSQGWVTDLAARLRTAAGTEPAPRRPVWASLARAVVDTAALATVALLLFGTVGALTVTVAPAIDVEMALAALLVVGMGMGAWFARRTRWWQGVLAVAGWPLLVPVHVFRQRRGGGSLATAAAPFPTGRALWALSTGLVAAFAAFAAVEREAASGTWESARYGYTISWEKPWKLVAATTDEHDAVRFGDGISLVYVQAYDGDAGDARLCLERNVSALGENPNVTDLRPASDGMERTRGADSADRALVVLTYDYDGIPFVHHIECRTIEPGRSVIRIWHAAAADVAETQGRALERLVAGLVMPDVAHAAELPPATGSGAGRTPSGGGR